MSSKPRPAPTDQDAIAWPTDEYADQVVLGIALQTWPALREQIGPDLWTGRHQRFIRAILLLDERGEPVDKRTVYRELSDLGMLADDDGEELDQLGDIPILEGAAFEPFLRKLKRVAQREIAVRANVLSLDARMDGADLGYLHDEYEKLGSAFCSPDVASEAGTLITRRVSEVEARPIRWLWRYRIPRGKLTILAGHPGLGKSQLTAHFAALVTKGGYWPAEGERAPGGGQVVILTAEDDTADTLRPRLEAAGADLERVHIVDGVIRGYSGDGTRQQRMFSLETDLAAHRGEGRAGGAGSESAAAR